MSKILQRKPLTFVEHEMVQYGNLYYHYTYSPLRILSGGLSLFGKNKEKQEKTEEEKLLVQKISSYRAKKTLKNLILCNLPYGNPKFLTLTYANPQFNESQAKNDFKKFIKRLKYHTKVQLRYIAVPEEHDSPDTQTNRLYSYHFHIIVFDLSYFPAKMYSDIWSHGFIRINRIDDNHLKVAYYISKYLTKSSSHTMYKRRFLTSRNVLRPNKVKYEDVPMLEFLSSRRYNRFTGGVARCDIYQKLTL